MLTPVPDLSPSCLWGFLSTLGLGGFPLGIKVHGAGLCRGGRGFVLSAGPQVTPHFIHRSVDLNHVPVPARSVGEKET